VVSLGVKMKPVLLVLRGILVLSILLVVFFLPAGSLDWPEAWLVLGGYLLVSLAAWAWMKKHDPGLLRERIESGSKPNTKKWDNRIMAVYSLLMLALIAVCGLDRVRWRWSRVPNVVEFAAFLLFAFPVIVIFQVIRYNHFLSERVRIQDDRGHRVCSTGPYARVRHPMYAAIILFVLLLPLALGSFYGLVPALLVAALFVLRTLLEDSLLRRELDGYGEYARQVPWRLIPGIW
jgi:protein-S-isoprenylcysteine O-methyltransferase Ste14